MYIHNIRMNDHRGSSDIGLPSANGAEDNRREADTATEVAGAVFGHAPSARLSFASAAPVEREANLARRLTGAENFVNLGPNDSIVIRRQREEQEETDSLALTQTLDTVERQREREEWARTSHSFGSTRMTGAEWQAFGQELRGDADLRRWLLERIRRDGHSENAARGIADRVADVADIMALPESQRTVEQSQRLEAARRDPTTSRYLDEAAAQHNRQRGASSERDRAARSGSTEASVTAGADELVGFTTAPDIRSHYGRAQTRATPMPTATGAPPPEVAATPSPSGFDI